MISIMLVSKYEDSVRVMQSLVNGTEYRIVESDVQRIIDVSSDNEVLRDEIDGNSPDIILLMLTGGDMSILSVIQRVVMFKPQTCVVLMVEELNNDIYKKAFDIGVRNIIPIPGDAESMSEILNRIYLTDKSRVDSVASGSSNTWAAKVVAVYGTKGGLGVTNIAVNMAVQLALQKRKVALLDFDFEYGDIAFLMNLEQKDTVVELVQDKVNPSMDDIKSYLKVHQSGVDVLCAPRGPEYAEVPTIESLVHIVETMKSNYDYVIMDMGSSIIRGQTDLIALARYVFLVTSTDIPILRNTKLALNVFEHLNLSSKVKLVVSRSSRNNVVSIKDVPGVIGLPVWHEFPEDTRTTEIAVNSGIPFSMGSTKSDMARSMKLFVKKLTMNSVDVQGVLNSNIKKFSIFRKRGV